MDGVDPLDDTRNRPVAAARLMPIRYKVGNGCRQLPADAFLKQLQSTVNPRHLIFIQLDVLVRQALCLDYRLMMSMKGREWSKLRGTGVHRHTRVYSRFGVWKVNDVIILATFIFRYFSYAVV